MQSWQTVVVCVAVTLVQHAAFGHPRALEEESGPTLLKLKEDVDQRQQQGGMWVPIENKKHVPKEIFEQGGDEPKKPRSAAEEGIKAEIQTESPEFPVPVIPEDRKKDEILGLTRDENGVSMKEENKEDDSTRSKKSTDMRELSFHGSPTTTVCIQVRSDHRPSSVVCGPQVGEDKTAPRYAYPPAPSQANYNPQSAQGEQVPQKKQFYLRLNPGDIESGRPFVEPVNPKMMRPQPPPAPAQGPSMSPKAARGPNVFRRTQPEEDNTLKTPDGPQTVTPVQPYRIIPQNPGSVVVHKQYYQAAPLSPISSNFIAPLQAAPLRFNCALQPEGAQFLQPYGTPILRSATPDVLSGFVPIGGEVIVPDIPTTRNAQIPTDYQGYYYDPQGRTVQTDEMTPYEYAAEPSGGTTFIGEDGQIYKIDDYQPRSALDDQLEQGNYRAAPPSGVTMLENMHMLRSKYHEQEEQLKLSSEKLEQLQKQLKEIQRSASDAGKKEKGPSVNLKELPPAKEPTSTDEVKKPIQNKNKRQSFHSISRK